MFDINVPDTLNRRQPVRDMGPVGTGGALAPKPFYGIANSAVYGYNDTYLTHYFKQPTFTPGDWMVAFFTIRGLLTSSFQYTVVSTDSATAQSPCLSISYSNGQLLFKVIPHDATDTPQSAPSTAFGNLIYGMTGVIQVVAVFSPTMMAAPHFFVNGERRDPVGISYSSSQPYCAGIGKSHGHTIIDMSPNTVLIQAGQIADATGFDINNLGEVNPETGHWEPKVVSPALFGANDYYFDARRVDPAPEVPSLDYIRGANYGMYRETVGRESFAIDLNTQSTITSSKRILTAHKLNRSTNSNMAPNPMPDGSWDTNANSNKFKAFFSSKPSDGIEIFKVTCDTVADVTINHTLGAVPKAIVVLPQRGEYDTYPTDRVWINGKHSANQALAFMHAFDSELMYHDLIDSADVTSTTVKIKKGIDPTINTLLPYNLYTTGSMQESAIIGGQIVCYNRGNPSNQITPFLTIDPLTQTVTPIGASNFPKCPYNSAGTMSRVEVEDTGLHVDGTVYPWPFGIRDTSSGASVYHEYGSQYIYCLVGYGAALKLLTIDSTALTSPVTFASEIDVSSVVRSNVMLSSWTAGGKRYLGVPIGSGDQTNGQAIATKVYDITTGIPQPVASGTTTLPGQWGFVKQFTEGPNEFLIVTPLPNHNQTVTTVTPMALLYKWNTVTESPELVQCLPDVVAINHYIDNSVVPARHHFSGTCTFNGGSATSAEWTGTSFTDIKQELPYGAVLSYPFVDGGTRYLYAIFADTPTRAYHGATTWKDNQWKINPPAPRMINVSGKEMLVALMTDAYVEVSTLDKTLLEFYPTTLRLNNLDDNQYARTTSINADALDETLTDYTDPFGRRLAFNRGGGGAHQADSAMAYIQCPLSLKWYPLVVGVAISASVNSVVASNVVLYDDMLLMPECISTGAGSILSLSGPSQCTATVLTIAVLSRGSNGSQKALTIHNGVLYYVSYGNSGGTWNIYSIAKNGDGHISGYNTDLYVTTSQSGTYSVACPTIIRKANSLLFIGTYSNRGASVEYDFTTKVMTTRTLYGTGIFGSNTGTKVVKYGTKIHIFITAAEAGTRMMTYDTATETIVDWNQPTTVPRWAFPTYNLVDMGGDVFRTLGLASGSGVTNKLFWHDLNMATSTFTSTAALEDHLSTASSLTWVSDTDFIMVSNATSPLNSFWGVGVHYKADYNTMAVTKQKSLVWPMDPNITFVDEGATTKIILDSRGIAASQANVIAFFNKATGAFTWYIPLNDAHDPATFIMSDGLTPHLTVQVASDREAINYLYTNANGVSRTVDEPNAQQVPNIGYPSFCTDPRYIGLQSGVVMAFKGKTSYDVKLLPPINTVAKAFISDTIPFLSHTANPYPALMASYIAGNQYNGLYCNASLFDQPFKSGSYFEVTVFSLPTSGDTMYIELGKLGDKLHTKQIVIQTTKSDISLIGLSSTYNRNSVSDSASFTARAHEYERTFGVHIKDNGVVDIYNDTGLLRSVDLGINGATLYRVSVSTISAWYSGFAINTGDKPAVLSLPVGAAFQKLTDIASVLRVTDGNYHTDNLWTNIYKYGSTRYGTGLALTKTTNGVVDAQQFHTPPVRLYLTSLSGTGFQVVKSRSTGLPAQYMISGSKSAQVVMGIDGTPLAVHPSHTSFNTTLGNGVIMPVGPEYGVIPREMEFPGGGELTLSHGYGTDLPDAIMILTDGGQQPILWIKEFGNSAYRQPLTLDKTTATPWIEVNPHTVTFRQVGAFDPVAATTNALVLFLKSIPDLSYYGKDRIRGSSISNMQVQAGPCMTLTGSINMQSGYNILGISHIGTGSCNIIGSGALDVNTYIPSISDAIMLKFPGNNSSVYYRNRGFNYGG